MDGLTTLKDFVDLGGVFILALVMCYGWFKKLGSIDNKLTRLLALMTVLVKGATDFNDVDKVLDKEVNGVEKVLGHPVSKL